MKGKDPMSIHSNFSIIYRHGRMMHDRAMREFGLSGQQMGYLRFVFENPGVSQEDIASFLMIDKGAVAKGSCAESRTRKTSGRTACTSRTKPA